MSESSETFTKEQVIASIRVWLEMGEQEYAKANPPEGPPGRFGLFAGGGWDATCLRCHKEQLEKETVITAVDDKAVRLGTQAILRLDALQIDRCSSWNRERAEKQSQAVLNAVGWAETRKLVFQKFEELATARAEIAKLEAEIEELRQRFC